MGRIRLALFLIVIIAGFSTLYLLHTKKTKTPLEVTLAPAFQLLGKSTKMLDRTLTTVIPVGSIDEKEFGDAIARRFQSISVESGPDHRYLNALMQTIALHKKKSFRYRVLILDRPMPNAFALPGGVIIATSALLRTMQSEAELVAILAHEMGHIELSHCLDAVRFELLAKKIGDAELGKLADFSVSVMLRHSFSKTQENEADEYAFQLLQNSRYNPQALGRSFTSFMNYLDDPVRKKRRDQTDIIRDYFMTHPRLSSRAEKFTEMARIWWESHPKESRYNGTRNIVERLSMSRIAYASEWTMGGR